jgi:activator of HSP90 ATPase
MVEYYKKSNITARLTFSRRQIVAGAFAILAGRPAVAETTITGSKTIHQEEDFPAKPEKIYESLLDPAQFQAFTGSRAESSGAAGGVFSIFDGHIVGRHLELDPGRRIVQAWRVIDWPAGVYSIARFELRAQGSGGRIVFEHTGFPPDLADHLASGWQQNYWQPLRKHLTHAAA